MASLLKSLKRLAPVAKVTAGGATEEAAELAAKRAAHQAALNAALKAAKAGSATAKETLQSATLKSAQWAATHPKTVVGGLTAAAAAATALKRFQDKDGSRFTIDSIKAGGKGVTISFTPSAEITKFDTVDAGTKGIMVLHTSFEAQMAGVIGDAAGDAASIAAGATSSVADALGVPDVADYAIYIEIAAAIIALVAVAYVVRTFKSVR
ncbi:hypothetical protein JKP88DRAFT_272948 [Tribonema minus]|uniref:Uncharacterized protein n=1 Tax=Tribonema minus TaxID=303371 RepID=A0A836CEN2_9STRA|nr:hypothetical protein JKP88DRAFT_272948 [Tribonema minus]